jgi:hypothetical protein
MWLAKPGVLLDSIGHARGWSARGEGRIGHERRGVPAVQLSPASAFGSGRKTL